jgi:hypothetical protein
MMTSCSEYELLISQKLDNELSTTEEELLSIHLQTCADCRALYQDLTHLQKTLSSLSVSPPPNLHDRIVQQIKEETAAAAPLHSGRSRKPLFKWLTAAALVLLVSGAVLTKQLNPVSSDNATMGAGKTYSAPLSTEPAVPEPEIEQETEPPIYEGTSDATQEIPQNDVSNRETAPKSIPQEETISDTQETLNANALATPEPPCEAEKFYGSPPSTSTEDASEEAPAEARTATFLPENITYEQAEALLIEFLSQGNPTLPQIVYLGLSSDGASYQFLCTDDAGKDLNYSVALSDGTIQCESITDTTIP